MFNAVRLTAATTVVVAALAAAGPAAAQAPSPTLRFDEPCASPLSGLAYAGTGYTPGGEVSLIVGTTGKFVTYPTQADAAGAIAGRVPVPDPDDLLSDDAFAGKLDVTGNDQARIAQGAPPEQQFAFAQFRLSRFEVYAPRPVPGKRLPIRAAGFVGQTGKALYLHYRRGGRTLKTVRLGKLKGACGDLRKTVRAFPFRSVPAGAYKLVFTTAKRFGAPGAGLVYPVRVSRRNAVR